MKHEIASFLRRCQEMRDEAEPFRSQIKTLLEIYEKDPILSLAKARQIAEQLLIAIGGSQKRDKSTLDRKIDEYCSRAIIPSEIASYFHVVRVLGNRQHAGTLSIRLNESDICNLANSLVRILEWYMCENPRGTMLESLWDQHGNKVTCRAISFIPFMLCCESNQSCDLAQLDVNGSVIDKVELRCFDDGFAVCVVERTVDCASVIDFLLDRRQFHLSVLNPVGSITTELLLRQDRSHRHPLIRELPNCLSYVMSVHHVNLNQCPLSDWDCLVMAEPSIVGITDDPHADIGSEIVERAFALYSNSVSSTTEDIVRLSYQGQRLFISWANIVVAEHMTFVGGLELLRELQVQLQKLWYKLTVYNEALMQSGKRIGRETVGSELDRLRDELMRCLSTEPTRPSHFNSLKRALARTSQIESIFDELESRCKSIL